MNKIKKKIVFSAVLILALAMPLFALPSAFAHTPAWSVPTYAYITVSPSPVGVNQPVTLVYWLDKLPPTAAGFAGDRWTNLAIAVTKPDGSKDNLGPFTSDPVGGGYYVYTPTQVGTYTFAFNFPGQVASLYNPVTHLAGSPSDYVNDTFQASSATTTLTVQSTQVAPLADFPLPTSYWIRPIEGQNALWSSIASNYLSGSSISAGHNQPDGLAPNSAHVMWTRPLENGGVVGGNAHLPNGMTYYDGTNYENKFADPVIMYGKLYYTLPLGDNQPGGFNTVGGGGYACVDLATGKLLWSRSDLGNTKTAPSFGQLYDYESMNQHGVVPNGYLFSTDENPFAALFGIPVGPTTWQAYDPLTGNWLFNLTNIPPGTEVRGPQGEILRYVLNNQNHWLAMWNDTAASAETAAMGPTDTTSTNAYQWRPIGKNVDMSTAFSWNVSIPALAPGSSISAAFYNDEVLVSTPLFGFLSFGTPASTTVSAISVKAGSVGQVLWTVNIPAPPGNVTRSFVQADQTARAFVYFDKETISYTAYSMDNGQKLWGPSPSEDPWDFYSGAGGAMTTTATANGKLYSTGYSGFLYCYDLKSGKLLWTYKAYAGLETPYTGYPLGISGIADGKIYLETNEHSCNAPYWRGALVRCVNTTDGSEIWTLYGHGASTFGSAGSAIADGYYVYLNNYDMQIYCIGKGPSKITVDAPSAALTIGQSVVIRGSVTDQSAGAKQLVDSSLFNAVPAASDSSMGQWMEYLYQQKPMPNNMTGVTVHLTALDSNGNTEELGSVVTDKSGLYSLLWTPPITGKYTITAAFEGSNSYWPSSAETAIGVTEAKASPAVVPTPTAAPTQPPVVTPTPTQTAAPTIAPTPTPAVVPPASGTPIMTYVAIGAVVIIIIAVAAALALRRRK